MKYKEIELKSETAASLKSEMLFEIASERVSGTEVIRFIIYNKGDAQVYNRLVTAAAKQLRAFKRRGIIQFLADYGSFEKNATEAEFLFNKYPEIFTAPPTETDGRFFVYVKL